MLKFIFLSCLLLIVRLLCALTFNFIVSITGGMMTTIYIYACYVYESKNSIYFTVYKHEHIDYYFKQDKLSSAHEKHDFAASVLLYFFFSRSV